MPRARKEQISLQDTPYYHCVSRCVRRAFLCGEDKMTGKSYEHRRSWVEKRLLFLSQVFAIDICAYAVMSNHTHVVLHVNKAKSQSWSSLEVLKRWSRLFSGPLLVKRYLSAERQYMTEAECLTVKSIANIYRQRLYDISWFMRLLNEHIAREANKEDKCTGRFWEGRFKSQALLDEQALLSCMAYVDLNPIRAKMASTPEQSIHTSICKRIQCLKATQEQPKTLAPFVGNYHQLKGHGITYSLIDYCELVENTGKCIREDKAGHIDNHLSPLLERLGFNEVQWLTLTTQFEKRFCYAAGADHMMRRFKSHTQHKRLRGIGQCRALFSSS